MIYNFSLQKAKRHVSRIKKGEVKGPFNSRDNGYSLKEFAKAKDGERFRIVVDFMRSGMATQKSAQAFRREPLAFIESICMVLDHSGKVNYYIYQTYRGIKVKRLPVGRTQKFFQKIYGGHFYVKK